MKINERYEIKLVVGELTSSGIIGDIYDNFKDFKDEHPTAVHTISVSRCLTVLY